MMNYISTVASEHLVRMPDKILQNWPWIISFGISNALSQMLFGSPQAAFGLGDSFFDQQRLVQTGKECLQQGIEDLVNANLWGVGYVPQFQPPPPDGETVTVLNAFM